MGYDSIQKMGAYRTKVGNEEAFLVYVDIADSNLYDEDDNMVVRRRYFKPQTAKWRLMQNIICFSADAEGGMLKSKHRDIKPETLIAKFRKVLDSAVEVSSFDRVMRIMQIKPREELDEKALEALAPYKKDGGFYGTVYEFSMTEEGLKAYFEVDHHLYDTVFIFN